MAIFHFMNGKFLVNLFANSSRTSETVREKAFANNSRTVREQLFANRISETHNPGILSYRYRLTIRCDDDVIGPDLTTSDLWLGLPSRQHTSSPVSLHPEHSRSLHVIQLHVQPRGKYSLCVVRGAPSAVRVVRLAVAPLVVALSP